MTESEEEVDDDKFDAAAEDSDENDIDAMRFRQVIQKIRAKVAEMDSGGEVIYDLENGIPKIQTRAFQFFVKNKDYFRTHHHSAGSGA